MTSDATPHRRIRSFVRREGRITPAQQRALSELWPRYGIELGAGLLDLESHFGRQAPRMLEIGFGNGDALAAMAAAHAEIDYLGVEVHRPGVGHLLQELAARQISNVRVIAVDAVEVLTQLPDASLAAVHLFFPDPWPKKRHHKRRLVQTPFVECVRHKLAIGGVFLLATDWEDYAAAMVEVLSQVPGFENTAGTESFSERLPQRPLTRFERRGHRLGHVVRDLSYRRVA